MERKDYMNTVTQKRPGPKQALRLSDDYHIVAKVEIRYMRPYLDTGNKRLTTDLDTGSKRLTTGNLMAFRSNVAGRDNVYALVDEYGTVKLTPTEYVDFIVRSQGGTVTIQ